MVQGRRLFGSFVRSLQPNERIARNIARNIHKTPIFIGCIGSQYCANDRTNCKNTERNAARQTGHVSKDVLFLAGVEFQPCPC